VNPLALASLICGILSLPSCFCCFASPLAFAAIITGIIGLQQVRGAPQRWTGSSLAIAGIACGGLALALHAVAYLTTWDDMLRSHSGL
jgi:hypothetical protein